MGQAARGDGPAVLAKIMEYRGCLDLSHETEHHFY